MNKKRNFYQKNIFKSKITTNDMDDDTTTCYESSNIDKDKPKS